MKTDFNIHRLEQHVTGIQRDRSPVPAASCHITLALVPDRSLFTGHQVKQRSLVFSYPARYRFLLKDLLITQRTAGNL
ncbi:hypothetical protein ExPCM12_00021 [Escherichia coli]|nr:hypothetical protein ExPCM12_00021 [Escherichia coli]